MSTLYERKMHGSDGCDHRNVYSDDSGTHCANEECRRRLGHAPDEEAFREWLAAAIDRYEGLNVRAAFMAGAAHARKYTADPPKETEP